MDTLRSKEVLKLPFSILLVAEPRLQLRMVLLPQNYYVMKLPYGKENNGNVHHYFFMHLSALML